ncbi:MAG TPA: protein translocase subunit SecD, partial [Alphaproteobacteria bacterium]|nr:protein translocase subunit SecD [Alphaproteobacteria bacterium]
QMDAAWDRVQDLAQPVGNASVPGQGGGFGAQTVSFTRDDAERTIRMTITPEALAEIQTRTVTQSIEVIRRRIDETGLTEPTIARQGDARVLVQVPGEGDPQRIIELVNTTASMSFHLVDST